ncbi:uncharacterized protein LOC125514002 [Triticum urartu]|uniref:uncharacterized protein LOC125514002 n=1 Tax=Triticum urartu TaxID=4572 RepID=UPI002043F474|nr:uncharacterized protein LOC125514002 [Triticum urartu]
MKNKDKLSKPTSAGRVAGKGLSTKWSSYYNTGGRKEKKTSSESQAREVQELRAQVARIPEIVQEQVQQQLGATITAIVPTLIQGISAWIAGGQQGPPPIPSFTASNSQNAMAGPLVSPAEATLNDDDDDTFANVDQYFADHGYGGDFMGPPSQEPNPTKDVRDLAGTAEKPSCNKRRLQFSSQETPPAADFTEPQIGEPAPSTIHAPDGPPSPEDISRRVHVAGRPMLPRNMLDAATGAMRSLHDSVLSLEKRRLGEKEVAYPVFTAKVPEGKGFVDNSIGGTIVLRFDDIHAMLNLHPLHYTFVRLFSLSMEMRIIRDKTPDIVIVDPFYMHAKILGSAGDRQVASSYLEGVILANQDKDNFLVPYFPDDTHCTLILLSPKYSMATYFDPDHQSNVDYTNVKKVLDDVLPGYVKSGGTFTMPFPSSGHGEGVYDEVQQPDGVDGADGVNGVDTASSGSMAASSEATAEMKSEKR